MEVGKWKLGAGSWEVELGKWSLGSGDLGDFLTTLAEAGGNETWMEMCNHFLYTELTWDQRNRMRRNQQTSAWNAYGMQNFGGKVFCMAIWQTGITWAPGVELLRNDINGAKEHVTRNFAAWCRRLARAVTYHKTDVTTQEARIRSQGLIGSRSCPATAL